MSNLYKPRALCVLDKLGQLSSRLSTNLRVVWVIHVVATWDNTYLIPNGRVFYLLLLFLKSSNKMDISQ